MRTNRHSRQKLLRDLSVIFLSICLSVFLGRSGLMSRAVAALSGSPFGASFVSGWFFTSLFTTPVSIAAFASIAKTMDIIPMAFYGAFGAMLGDLVIFLFIRDSLAEDVRYLMRGKRSRRVVAIFHRRLFRWLTPLLGAFVIASPLPDELGIGMMGFSELRTTVLLPVSFCMNFLGILAIGLVARGF